MTSAAAALVVEHPGLRTTVQDRGRRGLAHLGVPRSGAADWFSAQLANALLGNDPDSAVLESTMRGPTLRCTADAVLATAGAPAPVFVDEMAVPFGAVLAVRSGQRLRIGRSSDGVYSYVAVAGGIDAAPVLGSRSTDTLSGLGPQVLVTGAVLRVGPRSGGSGEGAPGVAVKKGTAKPLAWARLEPWRRGEPRRVRVVRAESAGWFDDAALAGLLDSEFVVDPASNRVGARLAGPAIPRRAGEYPTQGMVCGAIQVPPDGRPIVLLADHAVTGGYPVLGVVATVDLPVVAQARPGTPLRFDVVSLREAQAAHADARTLLDDVAAAG